MHSFRSMCTYDSVYLYTWVYWIWNEVRDKVLHAAKHKPTYRRWRCDFYCTNWTMLFLCSFRLNSNPVRTTVRFHLQINDSILAENSHRVMITKHTQIITNSVVGIGVLWKISIVNSKSILKHFSYVCNMFQADGRDVYVHLFGSQASAVAQGTVKAVTAPSGKA